MSVRFAKRSKSAFRPDQVADQQCVLVHNVYEFGYVHVHSLRFALWFSGSSEEPPEQQAPAR
jgi:hypothetical protein